MKNNRNYFSLYNTTNEFLLEKEQLDSHIKKLLAYIKKTNATADNLDIVYSTCYEYTTQIFKSKKIFNLLKSDKSLSFLLFTSCIHDALITFNTLLTNNIQVSSGVAFKEYLFTYEPIRITELKAPSNNVTQTHSFEPKWEIAKTYNRTAKKRAVDDAHKEFPNLIDSNEMEYLSFSTLNSSLYLATEYYSKKNGLPKLFQCVDKLRTMLENYKNIQNHLSQACTLLSKKHGIKEASSYFFSPQDWHLFSRSSATFFESVPDTPKDNFVHFDNQITSYDAILEDLFLYDDTKFAKALRLFSWDKTICDAARNIRSHFYPKYYKTKKLSSFLTQLQTQSKIESLNQLEELLIDCIELNGYKEFLQLKKLLEIIISLEKQHTELIKQMNSCVLQTLTEYYCSYHSNASIDSFTLYAPGNKPRDIAALCDYIQNLRLQKYIFAPDLCGVGLQYYHNPQKTISPEQMKQLLEEFSVPFPRGEILNHVMKRYHTVDSFKKTKRVLSDIFKYFYPTLTRLFFEVISETIKADSNNQEDFHKCCLSLAKHYPTAISKQLHELENSSSKKLGSFEVTVKHNIDTSKRRTDSENQNTNSDSSPSSKGPNSIESEADLFIAPDELFILHLNEVFKDLCPKYIYPSEKFLPDSFNEPGHLKATQQSNWINAIRNQSNHLSTQKLSICIDIAKYPKLPINATWTIMMADILTTFLPISHPDKYFTDLPKDALSNTTK